MNGVATKIDKTISRKFGKLFYDFKTKIAKSKSVPNIELENLKIELNSILVEKEIRQANFENAVGKDYVDIAISELTAIEQKYTAILRQIKELS